FDAVRVLETTLRNAARHRHLTALEREACAVVTGPRFLALDALTGRLASARATTATKTLLGLRGSCIRLEIVQRDRHLEYSRGAGDSGAEKELEQLRDRLGVSRPIRP